MVCYRPSQTSLSERGTCSCEVLGGYISQRPSARRGNFSYWLRERKPRAGTDCGRQRPAGLFRCTRLIRGSQAIVRGRVTGQRDQSFEFRSTSSGDIVAGLTENITTVEVTSVFKGELRTGDVIAVAQTAENSHLDRLNSESRATHEVLKLVGGEEYIFFLRRVVMPPGFTGSETSTWGRPGEPGFARLKGDTLQFLATSRYRDLAASEGRALEDQGGAPFSLDLASLQQLISEQKEQEELPQS